MIRRLGLWTKRTALWGLTYSALWGGVKIVESKLPEVEDGKLSILIADPISRLDQIAYAVPGLHDFYTTSIGLHFGIKPEVHKHARLAEIKNVVNDKSVDYMVVAGHGTWEDWAIKVENKPKWKRFIHGQNSDDLVIIAFDDFKLRRLIEDGAEPKKLFLRHTCGQGRKIQKLPIIHPFETMTYIERMNELVPGKIVGLSSYNEADMVLVVRYENELSREEINLVAPIMDEYIDEIRSREYKPMAIDRETQLGSSVVENLEDVRGWDYITNPLIFMFQPVAPKNNLETELAKDLEKRDERLAKHDYSIEDEWDMMKRRIKNNPEHDPESRERFLKSTFERIQNSSAEGLIIGYY